MARKSKYGQPSAKLSTTLWAPALYIRLSREDGDREESNSIASQRELLTEFVRKGDISPASAKLQLLLKDNRLSWCAFNIEGCYLTVDVTEAKRKEANSLFPMLVIFAVKN